MNFAGNASALSQHSAELRFDPVHAKTIKLPCEQSQTQDAKRVEQIGLIEIWFQIKSKRGARLVPHTIVIARDHSEAIVTRPQVRVVSDASRAAINPVSVKAFEFILESDLLRCYEAWRGVIKVESSLAGRQLGILARRY